MLDIIGLIGDVHAEDHHFDRAINFLKSKNIEILCTGDFCDGPGDTNRCIDLARSNNIISILGNHDGWYIASEMRQMTDATPIDSLSRENLEFLKNLRRTLSFDTPQKKVILCHGIMDNFMAKVSPDEYGYALETNKPLQNFLKQSDFDIMLNGHSHHHSIMHINGKTIINAGTLLRNHSPCFSIIDFTKSYVQYFDLLDNEITESEREMIST